MEKQLRALVLASATQRQGLTRASEARLTTPIPRFLISSSDNSEEAIEAETKRRLSSHAPESVAARIGVGVAMNNA